MSGKAWNMKLRAISLRVRQLLGKGSREHESASKSNESGRVITEGKQGT